MSVLLVKVLWYKVDDRVGKTYVNPIVLNDVIDFSLAKGLDIKNNMLTLPLKNSFEKYIDKLGNIQFKEKDQIKVYVKYTDDGVDVEDTAWSTTSTEEPSSDFLIGVYYVIEFTPSHTTKNTRIMLKAADKTYILFNKVLARAFTLTETLTAPEIIQKVIRYGSQSADAIFTGSGDDPGVLLDVDAKLEDAESGFITDVRRSVNEDGTTNTGTTFPTVQMAKVWKPVYEWITELSGIDFTNTADELAGTDGDGPSLVYGRPFIFWVDENNAFHWVYPSDTEDSNIVVGTDKVTSVKMVKRVFDVTNMIIFNAGTDMYNTGIFGYQFDPTSDAKSLKMRYVPMIDITQRMTRDDYEKNSTREGSPAGDPFPQFVTDGSYPVTPVWQGTTVANDSQYNNSLRSAAQTSGENRAKLMLAGLSHARWCGTIVLDGQKFTVGNLIKFTDSAIGLYEQKLRILDVNYSIGKNGFFATLSVEQDAKALTENA